MNYQESLARLLTSESTPKLGLERIQKLLGALGNPQHSFRSIHIAGTNGKGSTCAFLASLLGKNSRVGLYTSPHLLCARERIQIGSKLISENLFCEAEIAVNQAAESIQEKPTFFERITAMAFWAFAKDKIDIAVVEVGLGGRLDATNVVQPSACVITRIDLDHCEILGSSLEAIAFEKAGIIKTGVPVVTGWQEPEVIEVVRRVAQEKKSELIEVSSPCQSLLGLAGTHQSRNAAFALAGLAATNISLGESEIESALATTTWPARLESVKEGSILLDGAHNPAGIRVLVNFLNENDKPLVFVIGTTQGHDAQKMAEALVPLRHRVAEIVVTKSRSPRAEDPVKLAKAFAALGQCTIRAEIRSAIQKAVRPNALTIVAGSLYVAGEARGLFFEMPTDPELPIY